MAIHQDPGPGLHGQDYFGRIPISLGNCHPLASDDGIHEIEIALLLDIAVGIAVSKMWSNAQSTHPMFAVRKRDEDGQA